MSVATTAPARASSRSTAKEAVLVGAVDVARAAAVELVGAGDIGEHRGAVIDGERLVTHYFETLNPGYRGWQWAVTITRPPRGRSATVCEVELVAGEGALLAPVWVPWADRLRPGDVGATDVLPYAPQDERLDQGYEATDADADVLGTDLHHELGLGRARVLSRDGRNQAATRWYDGDRGPAAPQAQAAAAPCSTCGFFLKMAGSMRTVFGVCANEWSPDDGRVVSVDHGCGAHSETHAPEAVSDWPLTPPVIDEFDIEVVANEPLRPADDASTDAADAAPADSEPADAAPADSEPADSEPAVAAPAAIEQSEANPGEA
ncbi:DUF3027 domain-containing protein [Georgenia wangjunii]|uniref:DUF3027 domain-containing protein n=1 Tax=Georgenia wangjunii TaxID=3117730 RepID=UPI002F2639A6